MKPSTPFTVVKTIQSHCDAVSSARSSASKSSSSAGNGANRGSTTIAVGHGIAARTYATRLPAGSAFATGGRTALGNLGAGYYARSIRGNLMERA